MHCGAKRTRFEESGMNPQNSTFLFIGFSIAWLIIIVYVISIALREKNLRQELDRVKRMLEENEEAKSRRS
jgi:CcmD family protein